MQNQIHKPLMYCVLRSAVCPHVRCSRSACGHGFPLLSRPLKTAWCKMLGVSANVQPDVTGKAEVVWVIAGDRWSYLTPLLSIIPLQPHHPPPSPGSRVYKDMEPCYTGRNSQALYSCFAAGPAKDCPIPTMVVTWPLIGLIIHLHLNTIK